jgi:NTE family protein
MYHIGVWRALRELQVPVNAFIGNSIGAIISAFLAQGLYEELEHLGDTISIETIMDIPDELVKEGSLRIDRSRLAAAGQFTKEIVGHRGIDTSPMRDLLNEKIDEEKIRNSDVDLAVVTFNLSDMKPREVFIEDMEKGQLVDYVLASSAFPGFDQPVIGGKRHIDGGVSNNIPFDLATSRGYRNIIVVDLAGIGVNRRINTRGTNTVYIKISVDIGGAFDFDRKTLDRLRTLGYLDTLKAFGRILGDEYFLDPNDEWEQRFISYLQTRLGPEYRGKIDRMNVLPDTLRHERRLLYPLLDATASALRLERIQRYSYAELCDAIIKTRLQIDRRIEAISSDKERRLFARTARRFIRGRRTKTELPRSPYYYSRLLARSGKQVPGPVTNRTLQTIYPELAGAEFLLPLIEELAAALSQPNG